MRKLESRHIHKDREYNGGCRGSGELVGRGCRDSVWEDDKVLQMGGGDECA